VEEVYGKDLEDGLTDDTALFVVSGKRAGHWASDASTSGTHGAPAVG
jgi:hypothetical protein